MKMLNVKAVYILWLRDMKILTRSKSRVVGYIVTPLFFLVFLGIGLGGITLPGIPKTVQYTQFLVPGMIGVSMIYSSTFAGVSVLWDRQFGFLKEIMVTPVRRSSIVIGRIMGAMTSSVIQGFAVLLVSTLIGFRVANLLSLLIVLPFMAMISASFIGIGLAIASRLKDAQGFGLIMNFITLPLVFLSNAIYPTTSFPDVLKFLTYLNPLTFGIDGMRGALISVSMFSVPIDLVVLLMFCALMVFLGAYLFDKSEYT